MAKCSSSNCDGLDGKILIKKKGNSLEVSVEGQKCCLVQMIASAMNDSNDMQELMKFGVIMNYIEHFSNLKETKDDTKEEEEETDITKVLRMIMKNLQ